MLQLVHTAALGSEVPRAIRALLDRVFGEEMTELAYEHTLGGMHALVWEGGELIGHASLVQRRIMHAGRALRTGYVEGVAVDAAHRRRGHGATLLRALEPVIRGAYELGALGATDDGAALYEACGWRLWRGPIFGLTPEGIVRTEEDDGSIYVLPVSAALDLDGELTCDWREGDLW